MNMKNILNKEKKMRIAQEGRNSRTKNAIRAVQAPSADAITPNHSKNNKTTPNFRYHKYTNRNAEEVSLTTQQVIALGKEFAKWVEEEPLQARLLVKNTFWSLKGIPYYRVTDWCKEIPIFGDLFKLASESIGIEREQTLIQDIVHIRNRQSVYLPEYKEHDKEMLEYRERIKSIIEKQEGLSYEQQQAIYNDFMASAFRGMKENADSRRPKLTSNGTSADAGGDEGTVK